MIEVYIGAIVFVVISRFVFLVPICISLFNCAGQCTFLYRIHIIHHTSTYCMTEGKGKDELEVDRHGNYGHPFNPYEIQKQLMSEIYTTIEKGYKVGLFESPTGTGKTLSLICASMTWLRDFKRNDISMEMNEVSDGGEQKAEDENESDNEDDDEPEWVKKAYRESKLKESSSAAREFELHLEAVEKSYEDQIQKVHSIELKHKKMKRNPIAESDDSEFIPDDYYSDSELPNKDHSDIVASQVKNLLAKVNGPKESVELVNNCPVSIYYSSRTHSQLSQFAHQLRMTSFESTFINIPERTKFLPLASRKQLCIHPKVSKLSNVTSINDACIDMQKKTNLLAGCEFMPKMNNLRSIELTKDFTDLSLAKIHDIEDLATIGRAIGICPYYSVRKGVELTEMVALPYQMLLQESTRVALNLKIDNAIVIIDEAHNLMDVIGAIHSVSITETELSKIIESLKVYVQKFSSRLNSGNRINLMKLIKLCQVLKKFIATTLVKTIVPGKEIPIDKIFNGNTGDIVNVHKLEKFLSKSKIAYKIESYMDKLEVEKDVIRHSSTPLLFKITSFLKSLTNPSKEGKFFWDKKSGTISVNYMLLDPSEIFRDIVTRAKCVILCGGTMEPMSDYIDYLFPYIPEDKIRKYSCGHIVPDENLKVFPIAASRRDKSSRSTFEFLFDQRNNTTMIENLGETVLDISHTIPGGIVVFFPSYKYLDQVLREWKNSKSNLLSKINKSHTVFTEPTDSSKVERILSEYAQEIQVKGGAILFSVVGGKMSEGINFSDELARAVIMVGLPFPNAFSGELIAKRQFIESSTLAKGGTKAMALENARNFYENICMRAVNQSIGRSIRHIGDYSVIFLIDQRYGSERIQKKLSGWVKQRIESPGNCTHIEQALEQTKQFFRNK